MTSTGTPTFSALAGTNNRLPILSSAGQFSALSIGSGLQYLRVNSGATGYEWATLSAITGSLTSPRIPYATGAGTLGDDANFTWDNTNKRLLIGTGTSAAFLNVFAGSLSGTQEFVRSSANVNGNMINSLLNASNLSSAQAINTTSVGGASAGDPFDQFTISGVRTWSAGVDNSAADSYKIAADASLGTSTATDVFILGTDGKASIGGVALASDLSLAFGLAKPLGLPSGVVADRAATASIFSNTETGRIEVRPTSTTYKTIASVGVPTFTNGSALGTGGTVGVTFVAGNELSCRISMRTGTTGLTSGTLFTYNYPVTMLGSAFPVYVPFNSSITAAQMTNFYVASASSSGWSLGCSSALAADTTYTFIIQVQQ
jgi:hypothetical protein